MARAITWAVGAVLLEQHEHWQLEGRRMFSAESMASIPGLADIPALQALSAKGVQTQAQVMGIAALPQGTADRITARQLKPHIRELKKDLTSQ